MLALSLDIGAGVLLKRPRQRSSSTRDLGVVGNVVAGVIGKLDKTFGWRQGMFNTSRLAAPTSTESAVSSAVADKNRTIAAATKNNTRVDQEKNAKGSAVHSRNAKHMSWTSRSAERFKSLVQPFLLNFKSPDDQLLAAVNKLKALEERERIRSNSYLGGASEL